VLRWRAEYDTNNTVFGMGVYAAGEGIRLYDYARNFSINPQTYSFINGAQYNGVHAKGALCMYTVCVRVCVCVGGWVRGGTLTAAAASCQAASGARPCTTRS
jgi:hypothetical protein